MANIRRSRAGGFIRGGVRQRWESLWLGIVETNTVLASANIAAQINLLNAAALALTPFTIVRTRLVWKVNSDQTGVAENYMAAIGFAVVSTQATAIGVTAVPTPFTDLGSDLFFVHAIQMGQFGFVSGVGLFIPPEGREVDSRAMRKVEEGQDLSVTIENSGISLGTDVRVAGRFLIKLH